MARIAGVELPRAKRVDVALTYIFGIGKFTADRIIDFTGIDATTKAEDLTEDDVNRLRDALDRLDEVVPQQDHSFYNTNIEGDLRRETDMNIRRLIDINSYRGVRHRRGLPVRGQRTSTNARTRKGRAKTVGVGRKAKVKH
ncbi:30S ribosomal protein S13 [Candidatus Poribacteria bacterium]|jgi:small subunit ribosomal protein S13|nr:30S ribosomal protein S13 [Candidatus Poribacteria bacterium]MBT5533903.1 30S ribosomal protein S13 [Candidatus Poribacteria bacterium]MBT5714657.1 30S ribosomal protein S13 [Candidatus Poribacteria bacterium]MBT7097839.1 30S ribosomal protein S13 [Candidatus Poribacteria bacterium]MBT7806628.1 30S ribosomal protein S13 [Candidatus Poribacteria bacterium]